MEVLVVLAPLALLLGTAALIGFIWAVKKGQYDDLSTPAKRMLLDDEPINKDKNINSDNYLNKQLLIQEKGLNK